jgi:hypothetical protein
MAKLIDLMIQLVRMARYGAEDEFESAEEEHQIHEIPKTAGNKLDDLPATRECALRTTIRLDLSENQKNQRLHTKSPAP